MASNKPVLQRAPPQITGTWIDLRRWCTANNLGAPELVSLLPLPAYRIKTPDGFLLLEANSRTAFCNGLELRLGFPLQIVARQPFLHTLDLQKTLEPLLNRSRFDWPLSNPVIVIDPGHGGSDVGTRSAAGKRFEKEFTLDWATRVAALLSAQGWQVFLTRTNDADLSLSNRIAFADSHKAALFLSLHFNSAGANVAESGLETYCLTPPGMASTVTRGFPDDTTAAFPNNSFDVQNLLFAARVHRALLQASGTHDRGVRRARFLSVLRGQQRPAILVEGGYLSNSREARLIAEPAYRQKLALGVANALVRSLEIASSEPRTSQAGQDRENQSPLVGGGSTADLGQMRGVKLADEPTVFSQALP